MRETRRSNWIILAVSVALLVGAGVDLLHVSPTPAGGRPSASTTESPKPAPARTEVADIAVSDSSLPATAPAVPPVRVQVANVRIDAAVSPVGVAGDGQMSLPEDPDVLGWYRFGPSPGSPAGSAVLAGHVDSRRFGVGQLARLQRVETAARVTVTLADGRNAQFEVIAVERFRKAAVPLDSLFARTGAPRLVLVTCGGRYLPEAGGYEDNVVVTAEPVQTPASPARPSFSGQPT